jgi:hypothetical protein
MVLVCCDQHIYADQPHLLICPRCGYQPFPNPDQTSGPHWPDRTTQP